MESLDRRGALWLAAYTALLAGCASRPVPVTEAPPAVASSPDFPYIEPRASLDPGPPVPPVPLSPATRLPGEDVLATPAAPGPTGWPTMENRVRYGRGSLVLRRFSNLREPPHCPLAGAPPGCMAYGLTAPSPLPPFDPPWDGPAAFTSPLTGIRDFHAAPHEWRWLTGGRDAVYALTDEGIDRIDEQGQVTAFLREDAKKWSAFWVFEQGDHFWVLGQQQSALILSEASGAPQPGRWHSHIEPRALSMTRLVGEKVNAARATATATGVEAPEAPPRPRDEPRVMVGEPRFVALPTEGPDRWAMVWMEAVASGIAAHATRFRHSLEIDDRVLWTRSDIDLSRAHLVASLTDGQLTGGIVNEEVAAASAAPEKPFRYGQDATLPHTQQVRVDLARNESLLGAAFDQATKEGLIAVWRDGHLHHRRFDAEGKFLGEAVTYPTPVARSDVMELRAIGGRWYGLQSERLLRLSDGAEPVSLAMTGHAVVGLVTEKGQPLLVTRVAKAIYATRLDAQGKRVGGPRRVGAFPPGWEPYWGSMIRQSPGVPAVLATNMLEAHPVSDGDGSGFRVGVVSLRAGARWSFPIQPPNTREASQSYLLDMQEMPDDVVVILTTNHAVHTSWNRRGGVETTALPGGAREDRPLALLPLRPGPVELNRELAGAERECTTVMYTGAATLLACAGGVDPGRPGVKVSLRKVVPLPSTTPAPTPAGGEPSGD